MKYVVIACFLFSGLLCFAQSPALSPIAIVPPVPPASGGILGFISSNWAYIASALLGISESLALIFPSKDGFGGILSGLVSFLKSFNVKPPQA